MQEYQLFSLPKSKLLLYLQKIQFYTFHKLILVSVINNCTLPFSSVGKFQFYFKKIKVGFINWILSVGLLKFIFMHNDPVYYMPYSAYKVPT